LGIAIEIAIAIAIAIAIETLFHRISVEQLTLNIQETTDNRRFPFTILKEVVAIYPYLSPQDFQDWL